MSSNARTPTETINFRIRCESGRTVRLEITFTSVDVKFPPEYDFPEFLVYSNARSPIIHPPMDFKIVKTPQNVF